jgi:hypothetical protein
MITANVPNPSKSTKVMPMMMIMMASTFLRGETVRLIGVLRS